MENIAMIEENSLMIVNVSNPKELKVVSRMELKDIRYVHECVLKIAGEVLVISSMYKGYLHEPIRQKNHSPVV